MEIPEHGVLGQATEYRFEYAPELLFPIARKAGRDLLGIGESLPFQGVDRWTAYELSWLGPEGLPRVAIAEFDFSCDSANIIESKSLKLYLNSFNQTRFADMDAVRQALVADLSKASGAAAGVRLFPLGEYVLTLTAGHECLDDLPVACSHYLPEAGLLKTAGGHVSRKVCSHLFRSLCPVTGQPDWASVFIAYTGQEILPAALLQYLVSFRNHPGFHEQCVEHIFMDILRHCRPEYLSVYARFTRRGGLDINPVRATGPVTLDGSRESRQ